MSSFKEMKTPRSQLSLACAVISLCGVVRPSIFATDYKKHDVYPCPIDVVSFGTSTKGKFTKFVFPVDLYDFMHIEVSQAKWKHIAEFNEAIKDIPHTVRIIPDGIRVNYYHRIYTFRGDRVEILKKLVSIYELLA